jgi:virginiamycin B lyase
MWSGTSALIAILAGACLMLAPPAQAQNAPVLTGGPKGLVKNNKGEPLEGIMVQLIAKKNGIRTTVYSHDDGRYEFPKLDAGTYTLRIARPREFYPFVKEALAIEGAMPLEDITLLRVTTADLLPPFPEIAEQMTASEWMQSLSGTGEEKRTLQVYCNFCHSYQQIFRNRYDEQGWGKIVYRMTHGAGSPLVNVNARGRLSPEEEAKLVHWLATVRGPDSKDPPFVAMPRPQGRQTRVVVTEYELPRLETATHDVSGDADGNIWYSTHRSSYVGRLDPKTGVVTEFHVPPVAAGALPGTHWIFVDPKGIVWGSENWAHNIWRLDPKTQEFSRAHWNVPETINSPMGGNYALDPDGFIWKCREGAVSRSDARTGDQLETFKTKKFASTYGSAMSADGRYFGGGAWPKDGVVVVDRKTGEVLEPESSPNSGPARGEFDPFDNYWAAGRGGQLVKYDTTERRIHEYQLPTPYASLYTTKADKNGEVWAGEVQGGRYLRFDPKAEKFTEYVLPEPFSMDRESWIDNSTNPVSVWYVDHEGYLVHIQPTD